MNEIQLSYRTLSERGLSSSPCLQIKTLKINWNNDCIKWELIFCPDIGTIYKWDNEMIK